MNKQFTLAISTDNLILSVFESGYIILMPLQPYSGIDNIRFIFGGFQQIHGVHQYFGVILLAQHQKCIFAVRLLRHWSRNQAFLQKSDFTFELMRADVVEFILQSCVIQIFGKWQKQLNHK